LRGRGPAAGRGAGAEEGAAGRAAVLTRGAGAALVGLGGRWEDVVMAKTWSSVTVELLGGELASSPEGPLAEPLDIGTAKVARTVGRGEEFQYTFDLGDGWVHRCVVGDATIDPREMLGTRPSAPSPFWGWGSIPDQYGRRWADDDGEQPTPPRPAAPHPMQRHAWPSRERLRELDLDALHRATLTGELGAVLEVITGAETGEALQQVGAALVPVLTQDRERSGPVVAS